MTIKKRFYLETKFKDINVIPIDELTSYIKQENINNWYSCKTIKDVEKSLFTERFPLKIIDNTFKNFVVNEFKIQFSKLPATESLSLNSYNITNRIVECIEHVIENKVCTNSDLSLIWLGDCVYITSLDNLLVHVLSVFNERYAYVEIKNKNDVYKYHVRASYNQVFNN